MAPELGGAVPAECRGRSEVCVPHLKPRQMESGEKVLLCVVGRVKNNI